jgi:Inhibitor of vertebrate lysozyme (Ivy)
MQRIRALAAFVAILIVLPAAADEFLFDAMKKPAQKKAWADMMRGAKDLPHWLGQIGHGGNYVAAPATSGTIGDAPAIYSFYHACETHNCADSKLEIVFSPDGSHAFGMLVEGDKPPRWFGAPDAAMQAALTKAMDE